MARDEERGAQPVPEHREEEPSRQPHEPDESRRERRRTCREAELLQIGHLMEEQREVRREPQKEGDAHEPEGAVRVPKARRERLVAS